MPTAQVGSRAIHADRVRDLQMPQCSAERGASPSRLRTAPAGCFQALQRAATGSAGARPPLGRRAALEALVRSIVVRISQSPLRACPPLGCLVLMRSTISRPAAMRQGLCGDFEAGDLMRTDARRGQFEAIARAGEVDSVEKTGFSRFWQDTRRARRGYGDSGGAGRKALSHKGLISPTYPQNRPKTLGKVGDEKIGR